MCSQKQENQWLEFGLHKNVLFIILHIQAISFVLQMKEVIDKDR